jgi:DNA (cytosine-5)-methyltransferase 1
VGAPHARERLFVVAYASGGDEPMQMPVPGGVSQGRSGVGAAGGADGPFGGWLPEPEVGRVANGIPRRLVRRPLEALGNAVVPRVAELIGRMIIEGEK